MWEKYYKDKCSFEDIKAYGEELFEHLLNLYKEGREFAFVKDELPLYAEKYGGDVVPITVEEEAGFLMLCNDMELVQGVDDLLKECKKDHIPMYVLSNSGFSGKALMEVLNRFGIGKYFDGLWSSADFGRIKPCKEFYDMAIDEVLQKYPNEDSENILFVGGTYETDVKGAFNAGIKVAWINKKNEKDTEQLATYNISEMKQLQQIVNLLKPGTAIQVMKCGHKYWSDNAEEQIFVKGIGQKQMIITERLVIRPIQMMDVEDIHAYAGDPTINMMMFLPHETLGDTRKFVEYAVSEWTKEEPEDREYVILLEGKIIGGVNLERCLEERTYEIGWVIHSDHRGKGYATEAAKALQSYAFFVLQADQVQAHCDSRNIASERVMKKLGMTMLDGTGTRSYPKTGVVSGEYLYAITKEEVKNG